MPLHILKMTKDLKAINMDFEEFLSKIDKPDFDKDKIKKAYEFSKKAHIYQQRRSGEPYISHPLEVAKIVYEFGLDEASVISALLHDVVEDTTYGIDDINKNFGEEVALIVEGLTKINIFGENKIERNIEALRKILLASAKDIRILVIKLCDRLHNMRTLNEIDPEGQERISKETLLIYAPIAQKIGIYSLKWELEDLSFKYTDPDMFHFIKEKLGLKREEREIIVRQAVDEIKDVLSVNDYDDVILLGRPKNFYSIYKKIKDKTKSFEDICDLYAVRIIAKDISDCYTILGILHENFQSFPNRLKDYIANPKANGYQSIHTLIYSRRIKSPVEIQIRTEEMHKLAEFGVAAHWKYKNIKEDKKFEKKISWLREVLQWEKEHKDNHEFLKLLKFDFFEDEIFVFTPKNDVITLPEGSTVLDFAYAVHSEVGNRAFKGKVNGFISTIDKTLKSGDIVEVITHTTAKPNDKWLKFVKTAKARMRIREALNLKHSGKQDTSTDEVSFETLRTKMTRVDEFKKVRSAGCCSFEYRDQLIGVVGKDKTLVVHNASCENAKYTLNHKFPIMWKEEKVKEVSLNMILKDRFGILIDILNIFSQFNLNVSKLNTKVQRDGSVKMDITIVDGPHIERLVKAIKKLDFVESIKVSRGIFF